MLVLRSSVSLRDHKLTLEAGGRLANSLAAFFFKRGDLFMMLTYLSVGLVVVAVVLLTNAIVVFAGTKQLEKKHEKRMKEINEKEQV